MPIKKWKRSSLILILCIWTYVYYMKFISMRVYSSIYFCLRGTRVRRIFAVMAFFVNVSGYFLLPRLRIIWLVPLVGITITILSTSPSFVTCTVNTKNIQTFSCLFCKKILIFSLYYIYFLFLSDRPIIITFTYILR